MFYISGMYTVEFQKRGLPHAHILIWLSGSFKLTTTQHIDRLISAELPDPSQYPRLADAVKNYMIHGPCGKHNRKSPCMVNHRPRGKENRKSPCIEKKSCSKYYPKPFRTSTTIDDEGYPQYKRRDTGITIQKMGVTLDNRSVVPYNPHLLIRYAGHINVEYCNKSNSIKYLFKYVNKGPDRATQQISNDSANKGNKEPVDEIKQFYECRYVSPCEAAWRLYGFDIHHKFPSVVRLILHLDNEQTVYYEDDVDIESVVDETLQKDTMFLAWFEANKKYIEGRNLTYSEYPTKFVYSKKDRKWTPRQKGQSIGRLAYIPPGIGELFYMRILLTVQRGCQGYDCIYTVEGYRHHSFKDACYALGLLQDDKEFIDAIKEGSELHSGHQLRRMFVALLIMTTMTEPADVWNNTWRLLADGILYDRRRQLNMPGSTFFKNFKVII
ncbi:hypothetical protein QL285_012114 [Trifolium repens]|nr:hypothetical protein QL285_012114 [Trifolium repens]